MFKVSRSVALIVQQPYHQAAQRDCPPKMLASCPGMDLFLARRRCLIVQREYVRGNSGPFAVEAVRQIDAHLAVRA